MVTDHKTKRGSAVEDAQLLTPKRARYDSSDTIKISTNVQGHAVNATTIRTAQFNQPVCRPPSQCTCPKGWLHGAANRISIHVGCKSKGSKGGRSKGDAGKGAFTHIGLTQEDSYT